MVIQVGTFIRNCRVVNMEEEHKDDWHQKKSLCYVFSDVFSRSPNQEFVQNVLTKLYKSKILNQKDVEETVGNVLLRNSQVNMI